MSRDYPFHELTRRNMKKTDRERFYNYIQQTLIYDWDGEQQWKIDFVKNFLNKEFKVDDIEDTYVNLDRMGSKTLMYFLVSLLIEYENELQNSKKKDSKYNGDGDFGSHTVKIKDEKFKKVDKDTWYLEVEDIFPIQDMTIEEKIIIKSCLDRVHVDIESEDEDIIISTKQLVSLVTGIIREHQMITGSLPK